MYALFTDPSSGSGFCLTEDVASFRATAEAYSDNEKKLGAFFQQRMVEMKEIVAVRVFHFNIPMCSVLHTKQHAAACRYWLDDSGHGLRMNESRQLEARLRENEARFLEREARLKLRLRAFVILLVFLGNKTDPTLSY